ncbi:MAG: serine/threonine protein kinase [Myxococcales bacterium]|nr:serine/threonine protein kinase [Myxococcales bacterium]
MRRTARIPYNETSGELAVLLKSGEILENRYQILRRVAQGGFGTVYKAMHLGLKRPVALKLVATRLSANDHARRRIALEAQALRDCMHPSAIKYIDFVELDSKGRTYLVMEYIRGETLADRLDRLGPFPAPQVARILRQVAGAVHEAHSKGVIHRDLKPDNIMLVEVEGIEDFVKVIDFGLAKLERVLPVRDLSLSGIRTITDAGCFVGTAGYAAPEAIIGKTEIDARYDVYSMGAILYELLTGEAVFPTDHTLSEQQQPSVLLYHHVSAAPRAPSTVRAELFPGYDAVVLKALAKEPENRYSTMLELADAFDRAVAQAEIDVQPTVRVDRPGRQARPTARMAPSQEAPGLVAAVVRSSDRLAYAGVSNMHQGMPLDLGAEPPVRPSARREAEGARQRSKATVEARRPRIQPHAKTRPMPIEPELAGAPQPAERRPRWSAPLLWALGSGVLFLLALLALLIRLWH